MPIPLPFYGSGHKGSERLSSLPKTTQPVRGRAGIQSMGMFQRLKARTNQHPVCAREHMHPKKDGPIHYSEPPECSLVGRRGMELMSTTQTNWSLVSCERSRGAQGSKWHFQIGRKWTPAWQAPPTTPVLRPSLPGWELQEQGAYGGHLPKGPGTLPTTRAPWYWQGKPKQPPRGKHLQVI